VSLILACNIFHSKDRIRPQDLVALIIQAVGGRIASGTQPVLGGHIMLGGIAIQLRSVSYHAP
jgi:hypothetical protein